MDAAYTLARNVVRTASESIPADVVTATKSQILDNIGTALAGSTALGVDYLVSLIREWGGKEESAIISYGHLVPAFHAAQANATMAHALDYDDTHEPGHSHPSSVVVPTALAMAQRQGNVNGKEFIAAVALGIDLACRLAIATKWNKPHLGGGGGWHFTSLYGYFSAAATAGRITGLSEEQMVNALGIAYHQAAGNTQCVVDGAMTKRMGPGFAARGGIVAARMAERGITGSKNIFEAERGIYNLYHAGYDPGKLTGELGRRFEGIHISIKPYPCCRYIHQYIDTVLRMINSNHIEPEQIKEIIINVHPRILGIVCSPLEIKRNPRSIIDCQFSLPWVLACAIIRDRVGLAEFTEANVKDTAIRQLAQKIVPVVDDALPDPHSPALVNIKTASQEFSERGRAALGSPQNPLSMETLIGKFTECAKHALKPLSNESIDEIVNMIGNMETLSDINPLFQQLA